MISGILTLTLIAGLQANVSVQSDISAEQKQESRLSEDESVALIEGLLNMREGLELA